MSVLNDIEEFLIDYVAQGYTPDEAVAAANKRTFNGESFVVQLTPVERSMLWELGFAKAAVGGRK